nr:hypothetical protein [Kibdelosporangium sp. MJ126-NF4]CEL20789.1 hypothetical protein [Kibdelosporangium sp. MJ126-NF4]CTQ98406.1 hypothetical protein [Kibdelosporangium sp. MJ126-NF4]
MSLCRETKGESRATAVDVLPRALTAAYFVLAIHGLLLLVGADLTLSGPSLTPGQCLAAACVYLLRRVWLAVDNDRAPGGSAGR